MSTSDSDLTRAVEQVLLDPSAPLAAILRDSHFGISAKDLVQLTQKLLQTEEDVETEVSKAVAELGGEAQRAIHLNDLPRKAWNRLLGKTPPPDNGPGLVYVFPASFFEDRGHDAPNNLQLPPDGNAA